MLRMWILKLNRILPTGKVFIKNSDLPICLHCLHFIRPTDLRKKYELYGSCKKFGKMNLITGEMEHDIASYCRLDDEKCGSLGKEYTEKLKLE